MRPCRVISVAALCLLALCADGLRAENPVRIEVYPPEVSLTTRQDRQSIVVQATYANGITRDVTHEARLAFGHPDLAQIENAVLHPRMDGESELRVEFAESVVTLPVKVANAAQDRPISFRLDVMPVFMKGGCNSGSCHGAARGKDGFRLSLFGFDPDGDYHRVTRELNGRRINLARAHQSLIIEKATGLVSHTGGKRFDEQSELYSTLRQWIDAGAPGDPGDIARLVGIELYPLGAVLDGQDATQRLTVRARYSDGSDRDITHLAHFMSNNENSAKVSPEGVVTAGARGEVFVMARFDAFTVGRQFIVLPKGLEFEFPETPEFNYIDKLIHQKLEKLRITPSEVCSDEVFLRRAFVDILGVVPNSGEYESFLADAEVDKRAKLIDTLLERKEFVELWVMKWAELLQIRSSQEVSYKAMLLYYNWLQEKIANNVPMDQMVRELLGAQGGTFENAATNYYQNETNTFKVAENVAQVFMGMRIQCAQCHNHPFDRWTQDDYYKFAAFFAQIGRKAGEDPRETLVFNSGGGDVRHPVGNRVMAPKFLGGRVPDVSGKDRRRVLAEWLASAENPFFATNLANIVWAHFFGRGIIHEIDDVRVSNPPVNGELLAELGKRFTEYNYDFKKLVRDICNSRTYQLSTQSNESNASDDRNFSHASLRRIRAEVLLDCISSVTETKNKFKGLPLGARAVQISDGSTSNYFLTAFGRAKRETVCSCEVKMEPNLSQALHLLNGDTVNEKIRAGKLVERRLAEKKTAPEVIEELYVRCLSRKPTAEEKNSLKEFLKPEEDPKAVLEDVFWSLLNSREFLFNH